MGTGACEKCGIDLTEVADKRPQIELRCFHDGNLGLVLHPDETAIKVHPGDALEIRWRLNYPKDGGPPTITEIGWDDEHRKVSQGDRSGADAGINSDGGAARGARQGALDAFADEGTSSGVAPDSFEKMTGFRAWIITDDEGLRSTAYREHVWNPQGPEEATCQSEKDGHHVSFELFRLREQAEDEPDPNRRAAILANIDREIMVSRRSPERNCKCGIYAVHEASEITKRIGEQEGIVYGRIEAWGKIADYDKGFRAEKAQIVALFRPKTWTKRRQVRRIAKKYGVPVESAPYKLPDSDSNFAFKMGGFWIGFTTIGVAGALLGGVLGYLAATVTYTLITLTAASLFGKYRR